MSESTTQSIELARLKADLALWRETRERRGRIPSTFWERAAHLADGLGVNVVAQDLHLNATRLRQRMNGPNSMAESHLPTFLELLPQAPSVTVQPRLLEECALEVDSADGPRVRAILKGVSIDDLARLLRQFAHENC